jgi:hypothetical protein
MKSKYFMFKNKLYKFRNKVFKSLETVFLNLYNLIPGFKFANIEIIFFTPRAGRGLKASEVDNLFLESYPTNKLDQTKFFKFNSRFWILTTISLLFKLKYYKKIQIVLIQYVPDFHLSPSIRLLEFFQKNNIEIIKIWLDSYSDELWDNRINRISHLGKINIIIDSPKLKTSKFSKDNNYIYLPIPVKTYPFRSFSERKTLLYYSGGIEENGLYKPRKDVLDFLHSNDFKVKGNQYDRKRPGLRPDYQTYREELATSLIGLNFTWKGDEDALVARTWEIFSSGVLLLQNKSNLLEGLFTPGVHYLEFSSNNELINLLKNLDADHSSISQIAIAGKKRYEELFSSEIFWNTVLNNSGKSIN